MVVSDRAAKDLRAPVDDVVYRTTPGWVDRQDTEESQDLPRYQSRSYEHYRAEMKDLVRSPMGGWRAPAPCGG